MSGGFSFGGGEEEGGSESGLDVQTPTKIDGKFTIYAIQNLTANHDHSDDVDQVPFFLNTVGVPTLRGRTETTGPYKAET